MTASPGTSRPTTLSTQQFYSLPGRDGSLDASPEWHEYNPDLRTEDNHRAVCRTLWT